MNTHIEKIAFGSNLEISAIKSKARIPIIYGNGNTGSINISIENQDASRIKNISFPLTDEQTLSENDYIGPDGLHIGEEKIEFNNEQILAYESLQDIYLYPEYTHIYCTDATQVTMKVYYYSINGKDNQIYVMDKEEQLIAVFNKEDEDTLINPRIQKTQNGESIFTFSIDLHNPKWKQISNPENLYRVDDMVFSTNFDTSFQETISENDEKLMSVTAYERQKLLTRKFVRAWNSTVNIGDGTEASINDFMVVILAKGNLRLKNDDRYVYPSKMENEQEVDSPSHIKGTSGYVLDALLYGTGWTTGICDAKLYDDENQDRVFDLETDQLSIYENILKVQEIWGGILVFDSVNKIVHHRDETLWLPYEGYEVKYRKNMQSLEKQYNNKIITRLCPLGEGGLNIASVNNDSEGKPSIWLENFEYTTSVLEGIENNPDITDPTQLMNWGKRKLKEMCKPSKELTVETILLYQVEGYELETIDLNDVVDVINYNEIQGETEQLRVISFEYGVWDKSDAVIQLSDITLESTDIFRKTISATNSINQGTLNSSKVITYYKNGRSIDEAIREVDETVVNTKTDLIKSDEEITARITQTETDISTVQNDIIAQRNQIAEIAATINGLSVKVQSSGGYNLIKNSVGYFGNEYWEGNVVKYDGTEIKENNEANSALFLQNGTINQELLNIKNGKYNVSFSYKIVNESESVDVKAIISDVYYEDGDIKDTQDENGNSIINLTSKEWASVERQIEVTDNTFNIQFSSNLANSCYISDLILIVGPNKQSWSQNPDETTTDEVLIGKGIQVKSSEDKNIYTRIDYDGNRVFKIKGENLDQAVTEMTHEGVETEALKVRNSAEINLLYIDQIGNQTWITGLLG